jgi:hypothetical protein
MDRSLHERFDHLLKTIGSERFLEMKGLGNEVPFFICPYPPKDQVPMKKISEQLVSQLGNQGIRVLKVDLYDLAIELIKARDIWEQILEREQSLTKDELKELLQGVLDPENHLVPAIAEKMEQNNFDVMFITGVGAVFPYIRSHTVLNNLQSTAKDKPTVMFFPGEYVQSKAEGASLVLFNRLEDDKYYRAFNIYHYQI